MIDCRWWGLTTVSWRVWTCSNAWSEHFPRGTHGFVEITCEVRIRSVYWIQCMRRRDISVNVYSRITFTKASSFCATTFSVSLTNLTVLLPQSRDCSCYVSRRILAPPPLIWAHTTWCTLRTFDISLGSPTLPTPEARDFVELFLLCGGYLCYRPLRLVASG